jgi:hypothetical protein
MWSIFAPARTQLAVTGVVPLDPAAHHPAVGNLHSVVAVLQMFDRQGAPHLLDKPPQQDQWIDLWLVDDLEEAATWLSIAKFEDVDGDSNPKQVGAKVEVMEISQAIGEFHWLKRDVFESLKPGCFRHLNIEASIAEPAVSAFDGAAVDDVIARRALATIVARLLLG